MRNKIESTIIIAAFLLNMFLTIPQTLNKMTVTYLFDRKQTELLSVET